MKAKRKMDGRPTRSDDGNAFLPDITDASVGMTASAADAEFFGEEYIGAATTGESQSETARDEVVDEEEGGPFIVLGEDGSMPESQVDSMENEGHEPMAQQDRVRGARWMSRGA